MVRCDSDVTVGTAMVIYATCILIKFDHIDVPCDIESVTSELMLSKNLYINRNHFPLYFLCFLYIIVRPLTRFSYY
uniref:Uncharacterized protein n=1 Tax=Amphimedon queenslandica TaxID=400682 RepID=A0A1X7VRF3_AMPQE